MKVRVVGITRVDRGNLKALADIDFGNGLTAKGFRIVQQGRQPPWVSLPVRAWTEQGGERMFSPLVEMVPALKQQVIRAILDEWRKINGNEADQDEAEQSEAADRLP